MAVDRDVNLDNVDLIDVKGAYVSAGFIDLHIHGSGGADVMDATPEALATIARVLPATGTTSFLATTMTMSTEAIEAALENVKTCQPSLEGAALLGVHLEGPFINTAKHGAQDARYVQRAHTMWLERYGGLIRMITLAPECEGGMAFIRRCAQEYPDVVLSIGHSDATYAQSIEGFDAGISHVTHLFNAMPPYHHREPGVVGACFDREDVSCDIIADGVHTHPHHLRLSHRMKGRGLMLITDAMRAGCMRSGSYDLGGRRVEVSGNKAVLEDGTLAGSVLKMNEAVRHMITHTDMQLDEAIYAVTEAPAQKLGLPKGRLAEGYDADLVIFDEDLQILATIVAGKIIYQKE